jgi:hypothetical protein
MTFPAREGMSVSGLKPLKDAMVKINRYLEIKTNSGVVDKRSYVDSNVVVRM